MAYLTTAQLRQFRSGRRVHEELRAASHGVFLSHSHLDDRQIPWMIDLLRLYRAVVFVDRDEGLLQGARGPAAAPIIRQRVLEHERLVVAVTGNLWTSKWIPWELGLADGRHGPRAIALFPVVPASDASWPAEREYLELYPTVEIDPRAAGSPPSVRVRLGEGLYQDLDAWIRREPAAANQRP